MELLCEVIYNCPTKLRSSNSSVFCAKETSLTYLGELSSGYCGGKFQGVQFRTCSLEIREKISNYLEIH